MINKYPSVRVTHNALLSAIREYYNLPPDSDIELVFSETEGDESTLFISSNLQSIVLRRSPDVLQSLYENTSGLTVEQDNKLRNILSEIFAKINGVVEAVNLQSHFPSIISNMQMVSTNKSIAEHYHQIVFWDR